MDHEQGSVQPVGDETGVGTQPAPGKSNGFWSRSLHGILQVVFAPIGIVVRIVRWIWQDENTHSETLKAPTPILLWGLIVILAISAAHTIIPKPLEGTSKAFWLEVGLLFGSELGVAMIVAYIIAWGIDSQARKRELERKAAEEEDVRKRQEMERQETLDRERRMTQDVFRGVLGIQHSSSYVRRVIETTLDRKIIRRRVTLMYTLSRLGDEDARRLAVVARRFMFLDQAVSFEFENLSSEPQEIDVKFAVPARHGPRLRGVSKVISAVISGVPQPLEAAEDEHGDAKVYTWHHVVPAYGRLPVAVKARVIKGDSDSEVWCSYFPTTEGVSLQVNAPADLHMGIRNNTTGIHRQEMAPEDNGMAIWKLDGPILPNNSLVFYWRTMEHEGDIQPVPDGTLPRGEGLSN